MSEQRKQKLSVTLINHTHDYMVSFQCVHIDTQHLYIGEKTNKTFSETTVCSYYLTTLTLPCLLAWTNGHRLYKPSTKKDKKSYQGNVSGSGTMTTHLLTGTENISTVLTPTKPGCVIEQDELWHSPI